MPRPSNPSVSSFPVTARIPIPAREGRGFRVPRGARFRVIDVEGVQVADLFAFVASDVSEHLSAEHTRVAISRLFPTVGQSWFTNLRRPILTFVADDSPGVHDMLCAACSASRYASLGVGGPHASCEDNLRRAMAEVGHDAIEVPQPVNFFESNPISPDGSLGIAPAPTHAGDSVTLRAELESIVVVTACPQDVTDLCGGEPSAIEVELLDAPEERVPGVAKDPWQGSMDSLGEFIRGQRAVAKLSQRDLAGRAGVSNAYLSQIERGLHEPSIRVLHGIAAALGVRLDLLLTHAGLLDALPGDPGRGATAAAIMSDQRLTGPQRYALLSIYRSFVGID